MDHSSQTWELRSNIDQAQIKKGSVICLLCGAFLFWFATHGASFSGPKADLGVSIIKGFGLLMFAGGLANLLFRETTLTTVDRRFKTLFIKKQSAISSKDRSVLFHDLVGISAVRHTVYRSSRSIHLNDTYTYELALDLKNGERILSGFKSTDLSEINSAVERMAQETSVRPSPSTDPNHMTELRLWGHPFFIDNLAVVMSVILYVVWYVSRFHQVCLAMWAGGFPYVFIFLAFFFVRNSLRRMAVR